MICPECHGELITGTLECEYCGIDLNKSNQVDKEDFRVSRAHSFENPNKYLLFIKEGSNVILGAILVLLFIVFYGFILLVTAWLYEKTGIVIAAAFWIFTSYIFAQFTKSTDL